MLDYRLITYLKLCEVKNYRITAENLNMTQPAVTQHVHFLENEYGYKLFEYKDKKLIQTPEGKKLESYARSAYYNHCSFIEDLHCPMTKSIKVGATKTIGNYILNKTLKPLLKDDSVQLSVIVQNTKILLRMINDGELDVAVIEGFFDKEEFDFRFMKQEKLVGICSKNHKFANREVQMNEVQEEKVIIRESGSGTREVFEQLLKEKNYSLESFHKKAFVSSFELIKEFVLDNLGISFVYESVAKSDKNLATFKIKNADISHEFNYVFLKGTNNEKLIDLIHG